MKYRKKPVVIDAIHWEGGPYTNLEQFCGLNWGRADAHEVNWQGPDDKEGVVLWNALENCWIPCPVGHWVIRGLNGELYSCAPDIFEATYEPVND